MQALATRVVADAAGVVICTASSGGTGRETTDGRRSAASSPPCGAGESCHNDRVMTELWLRDAVIYGIYPQSFADSNGDGIGDLPGVIAHLDHLAWLGIDTIWFNPCFASPFRDAGYDV